MPNHHHHNTPPSYLKIPNPPNEIDTYCFFDHATSQYTFVIVDLTSSNAIIIDPVLEFDLVTGKITTKGADGIMAWAAESKFKITMILETHCHADHLTAAYYMQTKLPNKVPIGIGSGIKRVQEVIKQRYAMDDLKTDGSQFDILLNDNDTIPMSSTSKTTIKVLHTPGHTPDSNTFQIGSTTKEPSSLFVGDLIFQSDVGSARCDFPGGSASELYTSVMDKIYTMDNETHVFVGHDYPPSPPSNGHLEKGLPEPPELPYGSVFSGHLKKGGSHAAVTRMASPFTTVGHLKVFNARFRDGFDGFRKWREERDRSLGQPRLMHASLQCNATGGRLPNVVGASALRFFKTPIRALF
ncbi:hypothetical protein HDU76_000381 [Blyttiomyces sp. JEL0837]|nr:hypothetical protein HDU76_000381 [Blyttiomyces sp. JEL0837]